MFTLPVLQRKCKEWHVEIKAKLCHLEFYVRNCSNLLWSKTLKGHQTTEHQFNTGTFSKEQLTKCVSTSIYKSETWNVQILKLSLFVRAAGQEKEKR